MVYVSETGEEGLEQGTKNMSHQTLHMTHTHIRTRTRTRTVYVPAATCPIGGPVHTSLHMWPAAGSAAGPWGLLVVRALHVLHGQHCGWSYARVRDYQQ